MQDIFFLEENLNILQFHVICFIILYKYFTTYWYSLIGKQVEDVGTKIFQLIEFLLQSDNELLVPERQKKKKKNWGSLTSFQGESMWKTTLILKNQHGLQGFIVKSIEGESTEADDLNHIL